MDIRNLPTPAFLVDLTILQRNINRMAALCSATQTELWPMLKTHKCSYIADLQLAAGAKGFLAGTLDEAEGLASRGIQEIMLAYPVVGDANIARVIQLAAKTKLYLTIDNLEQAGWMNTALLAAKTSLSYLVKLNIGLNRLGIEPADLVEFLTAMKSYDHLRFAGIATHPGHVYGVADKTQVPAVAAREQAILEKAAADMKAAGFSFRFVATGSTPTAGLVAGNAAINVLRPGNYVFHDTIQIGLGIAAEDDCALAVMGTIISAPRPGIMIVDVGSKCLGLDTGAHGNTLVKGFGTIKGHPELELTALSEQIGKILIKSATALKVGDRIEIIPNHACAAANMTSYLIGHKKGNVVSKIKIDMRDGAKEPLM